MKNTRVLATIMILLAIISFGSVPSQSADAASAIQSVRMPSLIGMLDGQVRWQLSSHGYKFFVGNTRSNPGYNTKISCLLSGRNYVVKQSPAAGLWVPNSSSTQVTVWVNCG